MTYKITPQDSQIFHTDGESLAAKKLYVNKLIEEHQNMTDPHVSDFGICVAIVHLSAVVDEMIKDAFGVSLTHKRQQFKEMVDEEYEIDCDGSSGAPRYLKNKIANMKEQIDELEKAHLLED